MGEDGFEYTNWGFVVRGWSIRARNTMVLIDGSVLHTIRLTKSDEGVVGGSSIR